MSGQPGNRCAQLTELNRARNDLYAFLGSAFLSPPTAAAIKALTDEEFLTGVAELLGEAMLTEFREYAKASGRIATMQQEARQEFMRLFKVPGVQYLTPYESVFRDTREVAGQQIKGLLMGQSAADVQQWYKLAAVEISGDYKDLPDHIGLELNFLAHICGKEQEFAAAGDESRLTRAWEMERDFLAAHVVSWAPALRDRIQQRTQHAYFRTVADILVAFAESDLAALEDVVGPAIGKPTPEYEAIVR